MPRVMEIATPLGPDVLLFHGMHAREEIGRMSEYQLDLLSLKADINIDDLLGQSVSVRVALPDDGMRYFNGYVTRFAAGGQSYGRYRRYSAVVRPWLWFLTRTSDCRTFQNETVPEIVEQVFAGHPTADYKLELTATYRKWTYCVQYRETDFNFISRLMEEEGIYYYFRHVDGRHTMVLTDSLAKHVATTGYEVLRFVPAGQVVRPDYEHISSWDVSREIQPGAYVHDDYDLERPSVELRTRKALARSHAQSDYEIYDYPGRYLLRPDGEQYADVRMDEFGTQFENAEAVTNAKGIAVGALITLENCPREDQNREHLVVAASYSLEFSEYEAMAEAGGAAVRCSFAAMPTQQQFRPRRVTPKPFVQGPQTAVVVGPAGDQIHTDKFGRVKVQFHWDRYGRKDENSSRWVRVSHPMAGKGWGSVSTPRIGQEVIVDFLEGDPDEPIITGRVYNAENQPPFGFPAGAVLSGVKSDTHKGSGYNEMSLDDTVGQEKITIHGQYDMNTNVGNNQTNTVSVDQTTSVGSNQKEDVGVNREVSIGAKHTFDVGGDEKISVGGSRQASVTGKEDVTISGKSSLQVGGSRTETITGPHTIVNPRMTITSASQCMIAAGSSLTGSSAKVSMLAGSKFLANSGGKMDIKSAAALTQQSGAAMNVKSGAALNVQSTAAMNLKSSAALNSQAGGALNLKASGVITGKGSSIKLNSPTNIKGTTLTVK